MMTRRNPQQIKIIDALKLCQENNVFNFQDKLYKQKKGHATGQKQAPPVACGGAGIVERQFLDQPRDLVFDENPHILSRPADDSIFWGVRD